MSYIFCAGRLDRELTVRPESREEAQQIVHEGDSSRESSNQRQIINQICFQVIWPGIG